MGFLFGNYDFWIKLKIDYVIIIYYLIDVKKWMIC